MINPVGEKDVVYRGLPCKVTTTTEKVQGIGTARWARNGFFNKASAVLSSPLTVAGGLIAAIGYGLSYPFLTQQQRDTLVKKAKAYLATGEEEVLNYRRNLTPESSRRLWGFNALSKAEVIAEVEKALEAGNRVKSPDGSPHEYIILNNSSIILIPNGDIQKACVRTLYNEPTGQPFVGDDLKLALKVLFEMHDPIIEDGGDTYGIWMIDLVTKQVRGLEDMPDINLPLDGRADKIFKVDSKHFDKALAYYDPEKTESKNKLDGEKVGRKEPKRKREASRDDDDGLGVQPQPQPRPAMPLPAPGRGPLDSAASGYSDADVDARAAAHASSRRNGGGATLEPMEDEPVIKHPSGYDSKYDRPPQPKPKVDLNVPD